MADNNVLVTGGAGYIGSHTCKALRLSGYVPVTYDSLVTGRADAVRWGPLERGDLLDRERLLEVMKKYRPIGVIHFAGLISVGESFLKPDLYWKCNVTGTEVLLNVMKDIQLSNIVFSSTAGVYGLAKKVPIQEDTSAAPISPYAESKLKVEHLLKEGEQSSTMRSIVLRYFNAAGADPATEIGEAHDPETHLIPLVLRAADARLPHITVFGNDYATKDGTCIRDYVHVSDLASAHVLALKALNEGKPSGVYNLGSEKGYTVLEVIAAVERVTGSKVPVVVSQRRPGDPDALIADSGKARRSLNWKPQYTDLDLIVRTAWEWDKKFSRK